MWKTQKMFEEDITVVNESAPVRGSGGIAIITDGTSTTIRALMLPGSELYREQRQEGQYTYERIFAHVNKDEIDKVSLVEGKTKVIWNGLTYRVIRVMDYTSKKRFRNAEIELRRRIGMS